MEIQYFCQNPRRLQEIKRHLTLNAIDYLEVLDKLAPAEALRQHVLLVHCVKPLDGIDGTNVRIEGGVRRAVNVVKASIAADLVDSLKDLTAEERAIILDDDDPENVLIVETDSIGDFSTYRLRLVRSSAEDEPPADFDPVLSQIDFSFKVECPSDFDCRPVAGGAAPKPDNPRIDYLARDYASFRRLLLDRLSAIVPDWKERNPADTGVALVEALSYVGDYLSYQQDAVATEAYLGTARKRISVRRHARLVDYPMHEGCNARAWVQFQCEGGDIYLENGMQLLTRLPGVSNRITPNSGQYDKAVARRPEIFETMHDAVICPAHGEIKFYTWGDEDCCLPQGATKATLLDDGTNLLRLRAGDVLVFEEVRSAISGLAGERDPNRRHAVRLTRVYPEAELVREGRRAA